MFLLFLATAAAAGETPRPSTAPAAAPAVDLDELYRQGKQLFDELAPAELKQQFEFPRREQWSEFARRFQRALESDNLDELASYAPEARAAMTALRAFPGYDIHADWLAERLDYARRRNWRSGHPPRSRRSSPRAATSRITNCGSRA